MQSKDHELGAIEMTRMFNAVSTYIIYLIIYYTKYIMYLRIYSKYITYLDYIYNEVDSRPLIYSKCSISNIVSFNYI